MQRLVQGAVPSAQLIAVVDNKRVVDRLVPQVSLSTAVDLCDVLVECADQIVIAQSAATILERGVDLVVTSVGALADPGVAERVLTAGPGRVLFTSGAVGGLDLLTSATAQSPLRFARVTTTKLPRAVVQPWMDEAQQDRILAIREPVEIYRGSSREAARLFPRSLNVAASVAFAVGDFDLVEVVLVADPGADLTTHVIEAEGDTGEYRFEIRNHPAPDNPRTSGVVPFAVLRSLSILIGQPARIA